MSKVAVGHDRLHRLILAPVISEKSTRALEAGNHVVFKVLKDRSYEDAGFDSLWNFYLDNPSPRPASILTRLTDLGERRLHDMDETGIDKQILLLTSPGVQVFDAPLAAALARSSNDQLAEAVRNHPTRYAGLAAIAPQDPREAGHLGLDDDLARDRESKQQAIGSEPPARSGEQHRGDQTFSLQAQHGLSHHSKVRTGIVHENQPARIDLREKAAHLLLADGAVTIAEEYVDHPFNPGFEAGFIAIFDPLAEPRRVNALFCFRENSRIMFDRDQLTESILLQSGGNSQRTVTQECPRLDNQLRLHGCHH